ncbi:MAG: hypothetical protein OXD46_02855 [Chloroflexi bacterium]|nr:hypothetical protein [Chloroflexota bacterium]
MKSLDRYGEAIVEYEGVAEITFVEESGTVYKGYFEAKQMRTGGIAVGFVPVMNDEDNLTDSTTLEFYSPTFHGVDADNWELTSIGQTSRVPRIGFFGAIGSVAEPALVFGASRLKARQKGATESGYLKSSFLVSNLIWHLGRSVPNPITLETDALKVTITPVEDYLETADSIKAIRGIDPTARVLIESPGDRRRSMEEYAEIMKNVVSIFRLTTGNKVDWYYGEALADSSALVVERIHKDAVTGPFSKTFRSGVNIPLLRGLMEAFFSDCYKAIGQEDLTKLIDYFVNVCDETSYLEARGLLASTLADLIGQTHAEAMDCQNVMEEEDFNTEILPALQAAISCIRIPELSDQLRERAIQQLRGAFRHPFRKRLYLLAKKTNLPLSPKDINRAVRIRNELVHSGKFLSENREDWYEEYRFIVWLDFAALCRLSGYDGELSRSMLS